MDKQLVNDLKTIIQATKRRDNQINKNQIYDVEHFMDKSIIREYEELILPLEPIKPQQPVIPEEPIKPKEEKLPTKLEIDWSFEEWMGKLLALGIFALIIGFIVVGFGNGEYNRGYELYINGWADWNTTPAEEVMDNGLATMIVGWIIVGIGAGCSILPYTIKMIISFKKAKQNLKSNKEETIRINAYRLEEYNKELKQYYINLDLYDIETIKYPEYLKSYEERMKLYNQEYQKVEKIKNAYEKEKQKAYQLMQKHNESVVEKAEKEFDQLLESLQTYFPKKYLYDIETLLGYIIDARADTLKEAIALLIEDEHRNTLEYEARKAADDAETTLKIQKGMQQCSHCRNRHRCYMSSDNDGSCWDFESY